MRKVQQEQQFQSERVFESQIFGWSWQDFVFCVEAAVVLFRRTPQSPDVGFVRPVMTLQSDSYSFWAAVSCNDLRVSRDPPLQGYVRKERWQMKDLSSFIPEFLPATVWNCEAKAPLPFLFMSEETLLFKPIKCRVCRIKKRQVIRTKSCWNDEIVATK